LWEETSKGPSGAPTPQNPPPKAQYNPLPSGGLCLAQNQDGGHLNRYLICIRNLLCLTYTLSCGSPQTEPPIVRQRNTDTTVGLGPVPTLPLPGQAGAASVSSTFVATAGSHCGQGAHGRGQAAPTKGSGRGNQSSFPPFSFPRSRGCLVSLRYPW